MYEFGRHILKCSVRFEHLDSMPLMFGAEHTAGIYLLAGQAVFWDTFWRLTLTTALVDDEVGNLTWPRKAQQNPRLKPFMRVRVGRILLVFEM